MHNASIPQDRDGQYRREAALFVEVMRDLAPALHLDYSAASVRALEQFIAARFDPPGSSYVGEQLPLGVGCYVGEVIVRTLGGLWNAEGRPEINQIGQVQAAFPLQKAVKRFRNGPEDSLAAYYDAIAGYARQSGPAKGRRR